MSMKNIPTVALCAILSTITIGNSFAAPPSPVTPVKILFNRDIRPILSDNCFACHGPDKGKRQADLRLDSPNRTVVGGKPSASELLLRINKPDGDASQM